jgi:hypothetical protein
MIQNVNYFAWFCQVFRFSDHNLKIGPFEYWTSLVIRSHSNVTSFKTFVIFLKFLFHFSVDVRIPFYLEFVTTSILFCATQIALVAIQLNLLHL